jgi:hypothetical protein
VAFLVGCSEQKPIALEDTLFERLAASRTGINFTNTFNETQDFNLFTYRNIYNGGGVAIGDVNNDSLLDIYFTSNQGDNKLYLNEGGFQFTDVTESAGVSGDGSWSTGVSMVDVNADGLLDIYVLNSGPDLSGSTDRRNELFINQGSLTFEEEAEKYNLDDNAYSVHATFFDYDGDGDLDCYLLNNAYTGKGGNDAQKYFNVKRSGVSEEGGDKLFQNANGKFVDVSKEAGVHQGAIGFGLGIAVGDVNGDVKPDIYISNDFWERDYLYINQGDGTFTEELGHRTGHISQSSMGNDIGDINNDGLQDIYVTDMLPADVRRTKTMTIFASYLSEDEEYFNNYHFQYPHNTLQVNNGNGTFSESGFLSGTAATDWSWASVIFDFENDGWKDIFVTNGVYRDITDKDFDEKILNRKVIARIVREQGRFDVFDFLKRMPSKKIANYAFVNNGNSTFSDKSDSLGFYETTFSNGAAYGDLDNDGDLDLVISNIEDKASVYENKSEKYFDNHYLKVKFQGGEKNPFGIGAHVEIHASGNKQVAENIPARSYQSAVAHELHFGLGGQALIDSLIVTWPDERVQAIKNVKADQEIVLKHALADRTLAAEDLKNKDPVIEEVTEEATAGDLRHTENHYVDYEDEPLLPHMLSREGPAVAVGDVNGDNLDDFYITGSMDDEGKMLVQTEGGTLRRLSSPDFDVEDRYESAAAALFDIDRDGDSDLMVAPGGNQLPLDSAYYRVRAYENKGNGIFSSAMQMAPEVNVNGSVICVEDFDGDGDNDVFLGARVTPNHYGVDPRSYLLENDGSGSWTDVTPDQLKRPGMITDAVWADYNNDGDPDLVVVGEWMPIMFFENQNGSLQYDRSIEQSHGWWTRVKKSDLDGDGDTDFVLGNWGLNSKFSASPDRPLTMHVNDFDRNGQAEFIITTYLPGEDEPYPFPTHEDLIDALPMLEARIPDHHAYAETTYEELFAGSEREGAEKKKAHTLHSSLLINNGGNYALRKLPLEAQTAPVYGIISEDFNNDSEVDLLLLGNMHRLKPEVGRLDSNYGVFLYNDGHLNYSFQPYHQTGTFVQGEVRDASELTLDGERHIIIARNDDELMILK